jgi:hypothetical protein
LLVVGLAAGGGCSDGSANPDGGSARRGQATARSELAYATTPNGQTLSLEVRRSVGERARGMMGRRSVPPGTGMLFVFEEAGRHSFWMRGCLIPLDIVWLDARGEVVDVEANAPPCTDSPCPSYAPRAPASYVIEVGAGRAEPLGLVPGARVLLGGLGEPPEERPEPEER